MPHEKKGDGQYPVAVIPGLRATQNPESTLRAFAERTRFRIAAARRPE